MARLPPTTAEQRAELLADTLKLISPGFLSERVTLNGVSVSLRSPFPSDYLILEHAFSQESDEWIVAMLARLVWQVDGYPIIVDANAEREFRDLLRSLPKGVFQAVYLVGIDLINRMVKARRHILFFLWEDTSRDLWRGYGRLAPNLDVLTGISGLERLGLNAAQRIWIAWNTAEDQRRHDEFAWSCTKQTIAPHAPKAIEKMNKQEKQREETEARDRAKQLDEWFYKNTGVLDEDGKLVTKGGDSVDPFAGDQVSMSYTSGELADEMRRWVTGEMDWHDKIVVQYKAQIREKMLQDRMERDARLAEAAREIQAREENLGIRMRNQLVGYTPAQVKEMMQEGGHNPAAPGARTISYAPNRQQGAFDKWVDAEIDSGALVVEDGKLVARKEIPKPKKDERDLQSKINSRLPRIDGGPE